MSVVGYCEIRNNVARAFPGPRVARSGETILATGDRGCCSTRNVSEESEFPSLAKEGWLRDQEDFAQATLARADGREAQAR